MNISISAQGLNLAVQANVTQTDLDAYNKDIYAPVSHLIDKPSNIEYIGEAAITTQGTLKLSVFNTKSGSFKYQVVGEGVRGAIVFQDGPEGVKEFAFTTDNNGKLTMFKDITEEQVAEEEEAKDSLSDFLLDTVGQNAANRGQPKELRGRTPKAIKNSRERKGNRPKRRRK